MLTPYSFIYKHLFTRLEAEIIFNYMCLCPMLVTGTCSSFSVLLFIIKLWLQFDFYIAIVQ